MNDIKLQHLSEYNEVFQVAEALVNRAFQNTQGEINVNILVGTLFTGLGTCAIDKNYITALLSRYDEYAESKVDILRIELDGIVTQLEMNILFNSREQDSTESDLIKLLDSIEQRFEEILEYFTQQRSVLKQVIDREKGEHAVTYTYNSSDEPHKAFIVERMRRIKEFYDFRRASYCGRLDPEGAEKERRLREEQERRLREVDEELDKTREEARKAIIEDIERQRSE